MRNEEWGISHLVARSLRDTFQRNLSFFERPPPPMPPPYLLSHFAIRVLRRGWRRRDTDTKEHTSFFSTSRPQFCNLVNLLPLPASSQSISVLIVIAWRTETLLFNATQRTIILLSKNSKFEKLVTLIPFLPPFSLLLLHGVPFTPHLTLNLNTNSLS